MNGFDLYDVNMIHGVGGNSIAVVADGAPSAHVNFYSQSGQVRFADGYMPSYLPLNDGDTGIVGGYTSILTSLNSKTRTSLAFYGNRCLDRAGVFTVVGATGQIN
jgi:hypothetical protein